MSLQNAREHRNFDRRLFVFCPRAIVWRVSHLRQLLWFLYCCLALFSYFCVCYLGLFSMLSVASLRVFLCSLRSVCCSNFTLVVFLFFRFTFSFLLSIATIYTFFCVHGVVFIRHLGFRVSFFQRCRFCSTSPSGGNQVDGSPPALSSCKLDFVLL